MKKATGWKTVGVAILAGIAVLTSTPVAARALIPQAASGDTIDLTLQQALDIAASNNPAYRRAVNQLDVGGPESRAVWMGSVLPSVSVSLLNTGYDGNLTRQMRDVFGNPAENPLSEWIYSSNTSQSLNLSWTIQGRNIFNALDRVEINDRNRSLDLDAASLQVGREVRRAYFSVLEQGELLDVELASLEGRLRDQGVVDQLFRYAQATRVEVLNAELEVEEQNRAIRQQRRSLEQALLTLRTNLGDSDLRPFRVLPETVPIFDPSELTDDVLIERALLAHPDVRSAEASIEGSRIDLSEAKSNRWPSVDLSYRLGRQTFSTGGGDGLFDLSHDPNDLYNRFSVNLSFPYLSNYFQNRSNEVQAEVALRNGQETIRETRLQVEQEVRSQLILLRNQYETLQANRRRLEIAEEALRLAREEYRLGTLSFTDLQAQVDAERGARRESITATYGFFNTLLDLETAVGGPVRVEENDPGDPLNGPR